MIKYKINVNWTLENCYVEDWQVMTKDEYLNQWMLCQEDWDERVQAGAIIPVQEDSYRDWEYAAAESGEIDRSIEFKNRDDLLVALCAKVFSATPLFKND
jgi:hypothetical protein